MLWLSGGSNPPKGDALVIAGATLYAVSNVSEVRNLHLFRVQGNFLEFHVLVAYYLFFSPRQLWKI